MTDNLVTFENDTAATDLPVESLVNSLYMDNFDRLKTVLEKDYLVDAMAFAGEQMGKLAMVCRDFPNDVKDIFDDSVRDKAYNILFCAGSITAGYLMVRKLNQLYQKKQAKLKDIEEMEKIEADIEEKQKEAVDMRLQNTRVPGKDKREFCILCVSNRRECVFLDCGHICVCVDCLKSMPFPKTCPICRCKIIQTVLLFHA